MSLDGSVREACLWSPGLSAGVRRRATVVRTTAVGGRGDGRSHRRPATAYRTGGAAPAVAAGVGAAARDGRGAAVSLPRLAIRRRRQCPECGRRFSTTETASLSVIKRSGIVEPFSREKVIKGVRRACQGRQVDDGIAQPILQTLGRAVNLALPRQEDQDVTLMPVVSTRGGTCDGSLDGCIRARRAQTRWLSAQSSRSVVVSSSASSPTTSAARIHGAPVCGKGCEVLRPSEMLPASKKQKKK